MNILQFTIGQKIINDKKIDMKLNDLFRKPVIIAFIIGVLIYIVQIPSNEIIDTYLSYLYELNTPLSMIVIGIYFSRIEFKSLFNSLKLYRLSFVRLILIPIISFALIKLFNFSNEYNYMISAILLALSAPTGANIALIAENNNLDYEYAVKTICITTLFSIITLPILISVYTI